MVVVFSLFLCFLCSGMVFCQQMLWQNQVRVSQLNCNIFFSFSVHQNLKRKFYEENSSFPLNFYMMVFDMLLHLSLWNFCKNSLLQKISISVFTVFVVADYFSLRTFFYETCCLILIIWYTGSLVFGWDLELNMDYTIYRQKNLFYSKF